MAAPWTTKAPVDSAGLNRFWNEKLGPYMGADDRRAAFQLTTTALLYIGVWVAMYFSLRGPYWITVLLSLPAVGLLTRLFIFQHDCGHGSFFSKRRANNWFGRILGVVTLTPYDYWRRTHAMHHATAGNLGKREFGDVDLITVEEYVAMRFFGRLRYRVYRNPVVLFGLGPIWQFLLKHRLPADAPGRWRKEWVSVIGTNIALFGILGVAYATIGLKAFFLIQGPITLIGGVLGIWLFYIQHQFEDTYWRRAKEWDFCRAGIEGSSFYDLPRWLHWFTGNIGYHHVHHLASKIPNYRLRRCYEEVRELHRVTRLTLLGSLRSIHLHLWDEETQRLVSFGTARRLIAARRAAA